MTAKKRKRGKKATQVAADDDQVELLSDLVPRAVTEAEADGLNEVGTAPEGPDIARKEAGSVDLVPAAAALPEGSRSQTPTDFAMTREDTAGSDVGREGALGVRPAGKQLARARDLVEEGKVHEAIDLYVEILATNPASLKAHNNLGVLFDELGRHELAVKHFEEALKLEPDNVEVLTNHGSTLTALARYEEADAVLRRAVRMAPEDFGGRLAIGILSFRRGLYGQSELELRWVRDRDPQNGPAFYYSAEAFNRVGRFDEAAALMERAAELMPQDPRPFYTLGHLYDRKSLHREAADMYKLARELQVK